MNIPLPGWSGGTAVKTDSMADLFHNGRKEGFILTVISCNHNAGSPNRAAGYIHYDM
jgi:protein gp37